MNNISEILLNTIFRKYVSVSHGFIELFKKYFWYDHFIWWIVIAFI